MAKRNKETQAVNSISIIVLMECLKMIYVRMHISPHARSQDKRKSLFGDKRFNPFQHTQSPFCENTKRFFVLICAARDKKMLIEFVFDWVINYFIFAQWQNNFILSPSVTYTHPVFPNVSFNLYQFFSVSSPRKFCQLAVYLHELSSNKWRTNKNFAFIHARNDK